MYRDSDGNSRTIITATKMVTGQAKTQCCQYYSSEDILREGEINSLVSS